MKPHDADVLWTQGDIVMSLSELGHHAEALELAQEVLAARQPDPGPAHADTLWTHGQVATLLAKLGRPREALQAQELRADSCSLNMVPYLLSKGSDVGALELYRVVKSTLYYFPVQ